MFTILVRERRRPPQQQRSPFGTLTYQHPATTAAGGSALANRAEPFASPSSSSPRPRRRCGTSFCARQFDHFSATYSSFSVGHAGREARRTCRAAVPRIAERLAVERRLMHPERVRHVSACCAQHDAVATADRAAAGSADYLDGTGQLIANGATEGAAAAHDRDDLSHFAGIARRPRCGAGLRGPRCRCGLVVDGDGQHAADRPRASRRTSLSIRSLSFATPRVM